ncbi:MAG: cadherin-like beta sandwich domain-containing protein, partial [Clostridiales bacterium]|nr:cadherin-like beta sandwich domain-containing protein [Clostridiales bacterium]
MKRKGMQNLGLLLVVVVVFSLFPGARLLAKINEPDNTTVNLEQQEAMIAAGYGSNGKFLVPIDAPDSNATKIYTPQDLYNVRNNLNGKYVLMNDIDLAGFNGGQWVPIGDLSYYGEKWEFYGTFDGQGHIIKNMKITSNAYSYVGLFGALGGSAVVKNVGLESTNISVSSSCVGGICGTGYYSTNAMIFNCYNNGTISVSSFSNGSYVGGICGERVDTISYCYNTGNVDALDTGKGSSTVGGICASPYGSTSNCYNTGNISATSYSGYSSAGGICGADGGLISYCYNTGSISSVNYSTSSNWGVTDSYSIAGGICAGSHARSISNCYNTGAVSSYCSSSSGYAGGIAGRLQNYGRDVQITNCYSSGDVSSSGIAGGICGEDYGSISNCYNAGDVSTSGAADYSLFAGGISGYWVWSVSSCVVVSKRINVTNTYYPANINSYLIVYDTIENYIDKTNNLALSGISGNAYDDSNGRISQSQAISQATYENLGWDFNKVWKMVPGEYPQLRSNNAYLSNISLSTGNLDPGFDAGTTLYRVSVPNDVSSINIWATPSDAGATVTGTDPKTLKAGLNTFSIVVTAEDNTTKKTYTLAITRERIDSGNSGKFLAPIGPRDPNATEIRTPQDLDNVRNNLDGSYVLMNDIDLSAFNGGQWTPIGDNTTGNRFTGVFDGQGHVIKNLTISNTYTFAGLFGYIMGYSSDKYAEIKNVGLEFININISSTTSNTGGICGCMDIRSSISNCYNTGAVTVSASSFTRVGGICGANVGGPISNCYNTGDISSSSSEPSSNAGGICGNNSSNGPISNCFNTGDVSSSSSSSSISSSYPHAGGICGRNSSNNPISNCYNTGDISCISSSSPRRSYAGGICGENDTNSSISNCYNAGDISSSSASSSYAGGICSYSESSISDCYNTGVIFSHSSREGMHYSEAGGICGESNKPISNCYNTGNVSTPNGDAGGISGWLMRHSIFNCYNTGDIFAAYAGGIFGAANIYAPDSVSYCYNSGDVSGSKNAGGICGWTALNGSISNCVVLSKQIYAPNNNIIGYTDLNEPTKKENNWALSGITSNPLDDASGRISLTEATDKTGTIYKNLGWDFENIWQMAPDYDYPQFRGAFSDDAGLISLSISPGELDQDFNSDEVNYTASVPYVAQEITVSATTSHPEATTSHSGIVFTDEY